MKEVGVLNLVVFWRRNVTFDVCKQGVSICEIKQEDKMGGGVTLFRSDSHPSRGPEGRLRWRC